MTRLTNTIYITQHHQLENEWSSPGGGAFIMLSSSEQWDLHAYFEFTKKLTDAELIAHRSLITDHSLPQRAGRALAKLLHFANRLEECQSAPRPPTGKRNKGTPHEIRILSVVNPDINPKTLAKILIQAATERAREDRAS